MSTQKVEMTVERIENGQYVEQVAYPYVEYDHVAMENGMDIMSMIRDDVSTPMVTHNTTSWKVGQGDSDISESIVDSSVASMSIKGQTYQNILPSPSLRNNMTNGKTMQKLNEGYESVNTVDGVYKSAILSGQTLVNLFNIDNITNSPNKQGIYTDWITFKNNGEVNSQLWFYNAVSREIAKGEKLIAFLYVDVNTIGDVVVETGHSGFYLSPMNFGAVSSTGVFRTKPFTIDYYGSKKKEQEINFRCITSSATVGEFKFRLAIFEYQQGMENLDIPYFEGMQSVKMPVLTTTGKNLYNRNQLKWTVVSNEIKEHAKELCVCFKCKPNTTYSFTTLVGEKYTRNLVYGSSIEPEIGSTVTSLGVTYGSNVLTVTTKADTNYIVWHNFNIDNGTYTVEDLQNNCQIEESTVATAYEPYKSNILTANEDVTLRSNGSVCDELDLLTGKLTQRIDEDGEILAQEVVKTVDLSILDQDNQPIKQLNSFANGYIQVSSQEGTLIPSVDYEAPTSNSYHVDLMKPNTQYTMKNMQGTFTLDGTQYNASVNGTFTSPSTLTNKFMVTNVVQTQPMLLEGDMTNKEVPYVEGIKSAFDGVDKVEIVSQNADNTLSNTTSFQLSNPLRSLPNGVRDEIVLDRVNHKAKIIQRVGEDLTQLDTPIVTEVNLEGYPYVYKGGHIFLNTEIAPTTEVTYSINQAHQIESSNEDILRHQKEINHLYELIAQYVQVQYEAELIDIALQG